MFGWIGDLMYMDKTFDEAMAKRGYVNTNIRNEVDKKQLVGLVIFTNIILPLFLVLIFVVLLGNAKKPILRLAKI